MKAQNILRFTKPCFFIDSLQSRTLLAGPYCWTGVKSDVFNDKANWDNCSGKSSAINFSNNTNIFNIDASYSAWENKDNFPTIPKSTVINFSGLNLYTTKDVPDIFIKTGGDDSKLKASRNVSIFFGSTSNSKEISGTISIDVFVDCSLNFNITHGDGSKKNAPKDGTVSPDDNTILHFTNSVISGKPLLVIDKILKKTGNPYVKFDSISSPFSSLSLINANVVVGVEKKEAGGITWATSFFLNGSVLTLQDSEIILNNKTSVSLSNGSVLNVIASTSYTQQESATCLIDDCSSAINIHSNSVNLNGSNTIRGILNIESDGLLTGSGTGEMIFQAGSLRLAGGRDSSISFGPLTINNNVNFDLSGFSSVASVAFGDSKSIPWQGSFIIDGWSQDPRTEISVGSNCSSLTSEQLNAINWVNMRNSFGSSSTGSILDDNGNLLPYEAITPTPSPTPSPSITPTPSISKSPSPSLSLSPSKTPSPSISESPSPSPSPSPSLSLSPSTTPSLSSSITPTPSISESSSPSPSPSLSLSPSTTPSLSPSITPTPSISESPSPSPSPSLSLSPSTTPSLSSSITPTPSISESPSPSPSPSLSLSPSTTPSLSSSITPTPSISESPSPSPSPSLSLSPSTTPSLSSSITPTPSISESRSPSPSPSLSLSPSTTPSPSPTRPPKAVVFKAKLDAIDRKYYGSL
jgi:hypothetical protein